MAKEILAGSTNQTIDVFIQDSSQTDGSGLTGLVYNTASLTCYYRLGATGSATALSLATLATIGTAHTDGGFKEVDATNMPGLYRLDLSDAMVATAGLTKIMLKGAADMAPCNIEIEVISVNKYDSTRLGLSALPNAAADAAGGLPISDAGALDLDTILARITADVATEAKQDIIDGVVDSILTDTGTTLPAAIAALPDAAAVNAEVDTALADYDGPTRAELTSDKDEIITEVNANETKIDTLTTNLDSVNPPKNTALSNIPVQMVLTSDHVSAATGKTVTAERCIDGGAYESVAGSITEVGSGTYQFDAAAADMNADIVTFKFSNADCEDAFITIRTSG